MIYFIKEKGLFRNRVKIGFSERVSKRLRELKGSSPSELQVILVLPGGLEEKSVYHQKFSKHRVHGEWFRFGLSLRLFIMANFLKATSIADSATSEESLGYESLPDETESPIVHIDLLTLQPTRANLPKPKPKCHPDFVNAAIDSFLEENPDVFPTKGQVASAVGINGGKNYGKVISVYNNRLNEWKGDNAAWKIDVTDGQGKAEHLLSGQ